nr:MAG TPA_asm: helix-turn-helix domain protein [Caudoviricetes sp.]
MSVRALGWAWKQDLLPREKLILLALADAASDETWRCWPSHRHLAEKTGYSVSTVKRALAELEASGRIVRRGRVRASGARSSDVYLLRLADAPPPADDDVIEFEKAPRTPPVQPDPPGHADLPPSPTLNGGPVHTDLPPQVTGDLANEPSFRTVTETSDEPPAARGATAAGDGGAQTIVGAWIDACGDARPPRRVIGHLSKQVRELLDEGQPYADVLAAVQVWHSKGLNPASLPSVLHEMRQHGTRPRTGGERAAQAHAALRERTAWTPPTAPGARPPVFPTTPLPLQIEG